MQRTHTKTERQKAILKTIKQRPVATQLELRDALRAFGIECDQATVSRDIKELGLVRISDDDGDYRYALLEEASPTKRVSKFALLKRLIRDVAWSGNLVVIKTDSANAHPVAEAIDHGDFPEIIGTIAGDNTILAVVREDLRAEDVARKLLEEHGK